MDEREAKRNHFPDLFFDDSTVSERRKKLTPLAFTFEGEALPDKTLNEYNFSRNLLPESQAHHGLQNAFPTLRIQNDQETLLQDVTLFPPNDFERQLFFSQ